MNKEIIEQHGLTPPEYQKILNILGREPNLLELGIFSVMWSEHCSYKSSKMYLKKLPTQGKKVLCGPGENAGIIDIGDGLAVTFKIESHNHPSFIEPFQGAATGVGGILRDVFTMGARPVALLNSLRFGAASHPKTESLVRGVVAGIGGYGNCMGIPTVGGEVYFDECYNGNILVNAMCVGLVKKKNIFLAKATGVGNSVIYVGSKTGRDGIHGATMASDVFDEETDEKRPTVQVGDPFTEKLLMEACLELMESDVGRKAIAGIQDMGAAGLTCSTMEMSGKGRVGMEVDLKKVPQRETGMTPYELMLSESQERMFLVARAGKEKDVLDVFKKWDLDAATVGVVTKGHEVVIRSNGKLEATLPNLPISEEAPIYKRPVKRPKYLARVQKLPRIKKEKKCDETLLRLLASPNIASKRWVYRQYDHMIGTDSVVMPGSDAAVVRIKGSKKGLAMVTDCNSRYCYLDPKEGTRIAVAEAARNIVCSGAEPIAVTNCLNFGSPENPEIMWQFRESILGMSEACRFFGTPIVSGNVSFYNESQEGAIYPTPTIGMIGLLKNVASHCTQWFKQKGDIILLVGAAKPKEADLGGSKYLKVICGKVAGRPAKLNMKLEKMVQSVVLEGIQKSWVQSAHDCSEGGLAVALAECCVSGQKMMGAKIEMESDSISLFAETQSRILVTLREKDLQRFLKLAKQKKCPVKRLGRVTGRDLIIGDTINLSSQDLEEAWKGGFERAVCAA